MLITWTSRLRRKPHVTSFKRENTLSAKPVLGQSKKQLELRLLEQKRQQNGICDAQTVKTSCPQLVRVTVGN